MASMSSPEHGAQQECNNTFFSPPGTSKVGLCTEFIGYKQKERPGFYAGPLKVFAKFSLRFHYVDGLFALRALLNIEFNSLAFF